MMKDDDFKLLRGFDYGQTDRQTEGQTFVNVELLLQLKSNNNLHNLLHSFQPGTYLQDYLKSIPQVYEKIDIAIFIFFPILNISPISILFTTMMSKCFADFSRSSPREVNFPRGMKTLILINFFFVLGFLLVFLGYYLAISEVLKQYSMVKSFPKYSI